MSEDLQEAAPTVLITGASRGIGLELVRKYAEAGWRVLATCRSPDSASLLQDLAGQHPSIELQALDVADENSIKSLAAKLDGTAIDVLINNAGISGSLDGQAFGALDYQTGRETMETNLYGPLRMCEAFIEHVAASKQRKLMTVSSMLGSISSTTGGSYFYRCFKAAVNMAMATLARDVAHRRVIVGVLSPGLVATDLTATLGGDKISVQESVSGLMPVIEAFTLESSGQFMRYTGLPVPW